MITPAQEWLLAIFLVSWRQSHEPDLPTSIILFHRRSSICSGS
ncbi:unnamed protein product [Acidithrix sp. C25]|nr:unnamed protein product [Acidithrix sp. C25]